MTNTEFVTDMIEFGSPLNGIFVIDAIDKHCDRIINTKREDWPENHIINFDAWQDVARNLKEKLENR